MDPQATLAYVSISQPPVSWWLVGLLGLISFSIFALTWRFGHELGHRRKSPVESKSLPRVSVILCLRGRDPYLHKCLEAIFKQDYPNYDVHVVIDDPFGELRPSVEQAHSATSTPCSLAMHTLTWKLTTCSLKCNALLQALEVIDTSSEVVAFLDADVVAHPTWLRELVQPLCNPDVGCSTGQRWFAPSKHSVGSWLRHHWNAAATMLYVRQGLTWGGSFALKAEIACSPDVRQLWSTTLVEDAPIAALLRNRAMRLVFVPEVMMVNRESCGLLQFVFWAHRQTLAARLYNRFPNYPNMAMTAVYHGAFVVATMVIGIAALQGNAGTCLVAVLALLMFEACKGMSILTAEIAVRRTMSGFGRPIRSPSMAVVFASMILMPLTSALSALIWSMACLRKTVEWRGVTYRVDGPQKIRLLEDRGIVRREHPLESL